jgi:hypothetical protein
MILMSFGIVSVLADFPDVVIVVDWMIAVVMFCSFFYCMLSLQSRHTKIIMII